MDTLFMDYEDSLISETPKTIRDFDFFGVEPGGANQKRALSVIRYALEDVLGWDVETSTEKFDAYIIQVMKLDRFLDFIKYPIEIPEKSPRYILSLLYPERIKINYTQMVIDLYESVLSGDSQFPREYFMGIDGYYRFCICLQYLVEHRRPVSSLDELYTFITSPAGSNFLMENRLKVPAMQLQIDILSCLHEITRELEDSSLYYSFYRFLEQREALLNTEE